MSRKLFFLGSFLLCAASLGVANRALPANAQARADLKVCADPDNMPFSNERQEGFENRIAQLLATEMHATLKYTWWPQRRGFLRNTLRAGECDLIVGVPKAYDPVFTTTPYYRTSYVLVYREDRDRGVRSLDDTTLRRMKIGVNLIGEDYENPPPVQALAARGVVGNLVGYGTFYNDKQRPQNIIEAVARGDVDIAIVWGPLAGYFAPQQSVRLSVVPLPDSVDRTGLPMAYDIAMGVRRSDKTLGQQLNDIIARRQTEIGNILAEFHIPTLAVARSATQGGNVAAPARDSLLATEDEYQGWKWFHVYCYRCHGTDALGSTLAPNLRHSVSPEGTVTRTVFLSTVHDGRPAKGMPAWGALLDQKQIEQLYAYVLARSEKRLAEGRPHRASDVPPK